LINDDIRNNSAWNHRFFVVFESGMGGGEMHASREIE
jgi:protein farnesyltransferase/geranylgeranyltransferase type-1 subunit alpha